MILVPGKGNCARCDKRLGLRKKESRCDWGYQGKLCNDCYEFAIANSPYFDAEYKFGLPGWIDKIKGILIVQNFDDMRQIIFTTQDNLILKITAPSIKEVQIVDYTEESKKVKIVSLGLKNKSTSKHLQISYIGDTGEEAPIFHVDQAQNALNSVILLIKNYKRDSEKATPPKDMIEAIKNATGQDLVDEESLEKLKDKHGEINKIMKFLQADETVLFVARQSRINPGGSAITTPNTIFATDRRILIRNPTMLWMRSAVEDMPYESLSSVKLQVGVFSSTIVFTGPGFGEVNRISRASLDKAWGRDEEHSIDAIPKKDAEELVRIINRQMGKVKGHKQQFTQIVNQNATTTPKLQEDDLIKILKTRYTKGEITKEEFDEMKEDLS